MAILRLREEFTSARHRKASVDADYGASRKPEQSPPIERMRRQFLETSVPVRLETTNPWRLALWLPSAA